MTDRTKLHASLANAAYDDAHFYKKVETQDLVFEPITFTDRISGYKAAAFFCRSTNHLVIAHRGTEADSDILRDAVLTDGGMVSGGRNRQIGDAIAFADAAINAAKEESKEPENLHVTTTGHSLGGTLAQAVAHKFHIEGETFNAYGAAGLLHGIPRGGSQVINHVRASDAVAAASNHFGEVRVYATAGDIDMLYRAGYNDDASPFTPRKVLAVPSIAAHGMHNFVPAPGETDSPLLRPEHEARYRTHQPMIDQFRSDAMHHRIALSWPWGHAKLAADTAMELGHQARESVAIHANAARKAFATAIDHAAPHIRELAAGAASLHAQHQITQGNVAATLFGLTRKQHQNDNDPFQAHIPESPVSLRNPMHRDHALFQEARGAVHRLDAERGRTPDDYSENLAAALTVEARRGGFKHIDHVVLSDDGSRAFAFEGELKSPTRQHVHVQTREAVNRPVEQSSELWHDLDRAKELTFPSSLTRDQEIAPVRKHEISIRR